MVNTKDDLIRSLTSANFANVAFVKQTEEALGSPVQPSSTHQSTPDGPYKARTCRESFLCSTAQNSDTLLNLTKTGGAILGVTRNAFGIAGKIVKPLNYAARAFDFGEMNYEAIKAYNEGKISADALASYELLTVAHWGSSADVTPASDEGIKFLYDIWCEKNGVTGALKETLALKKEEQGLPIKQEVKDFHKLYAALPREITPELPSRLRPLVSFKNDIEDTVAQINNLQIPIDAAQSASLQKQRETAEKKYIVAYDNLGPDGQMAALMYVNNMLGQYGSIHKKFVQNLERENQQIALELSEPS